MVTDVIEAQQEVLLLLAEHWQKIQEKKIYISLWNSDTMDKTLNVSSDVNVFIKGNYDLEQIERQLNRFKEELLNALKD